MIEVDGAQHKQTIKEDANRDAKVAAAGVRTLRIPVDEGSGNSPKLVELQSILTLKVEEEEDRDSTIESQLLRWHRVLHQIQVALIRTLRAGDVSAETSLVRVVLPVEMARDPRAAEYVSQAAESLRELVQRLSDLWDLGYEAPHLDLRIRAEESVTPANLPLLPR